MTEPSLSSATTATSDRTPNILNPIPEFTNGSNTVDISKKDLHSLTLADILQLVNSHQLLQTRAGPSLDASIEEKVNYALEELRATKRQVAEAKEKYQLSIANLEKATKEIQNNNQLLLQNKVEIQENKIESQRTRIDLNALKQQTIEEVKNLNGKMDLLFSNYNKNFDTLQLSIQTTLSENLRNRTVHQQPIVDHYKQKKKQKRESPSTISLDQSLVKAPSEDPDSDIRYKLAKPLTSVRQIWEEYQYGIFGMPSVKSLDLKYKNRWRYKGENTTYLRRRKIFMAIEQCIRMGVSEDEAIDALEKLRVDENGTNRTMAWLFDNIPEGFSEKFFGGNSENLLALETRVTGEQGVAEEEDEGEEEEGGEEEGEEEEQEGEEEEPVAEEESIVEEDPVAEEAVQDEATADNATSEANVDGQSELTQPSVTLQNGVTTQDK